MEMDGSTIGVKPIFLSAFHGIWIDLLLDRWKSNGSKTHFYRFSMVYELIFILFSFFMRRQTDGSAMGVKPIFIGFPWCMTWSSSSLNKQLAHGETDQWERPIFFCSYTVIIYFLCHDDEMIPISSSEQADCRHLAVGGYPSYTVVCSNDIQAGGLSTPLAIRGYSSYTVVCSNDMQTGRLLAPHDRRLLVLHYWIMGTS
jgi:hypothetical protein